MLKASKKKGASLKQELVISLDISPEIPVGRQIIQRYGECRFVISELLYKCPVLVFSNKTNIWDVTLLPNDESILGLIPIILDEGHVDLLLLGCGEVISPLTENIRSEFKKKNIIVEKMDTGAACRTFNVLIAEDRRVAAALIPVN